MLKSLDVNPNANHREFWLQDRDGYVVVVAGRYGDVGCANDLVLQPGACGIALADCTIALPHPPSGF